MPAPFRRSLSRLAFLLLLVAVVCSCSGDRRIRANFALDPEGWIGGEGKLGSKVTVVDFWATWCEPCLRAMPELMSWQEKYGTQGLQVIGVAAAEAGETPETIRPSLEKFLGSHFPKLNFPVAYDSSTKTSEKWKIEGLPTQFVLSATGDILFIGRGPEVEEVMLKQLGLPAPARSTPDQHTAGAAPASPVPVASPVPATKP